MKQKRFTLVTITKQSAFAIGGLVLAGTIGVAGASTSTRYGGDAASLGGQQSVRLAESAAVAKPKSVKRTSRSHKAVRGSGDTWLNPQPDPPMGPAKVNKGDTWLNPQPEPPRPVTGSKKLR